MSERVTSYVSTARAEERQTSCGFLQFLELAIFDHALEGLLRNIFGEIELPPQSAIGCADSSAPGAEEKDTPSLLVAAAGGELAKRLGKLLFRNGFHWPYGSLSTAQRTAKR